MRVIAVVLLILTTAAPAAAELYQWTDAAGVSHYTSDLSSIPESYRPGARDIGSPRPREGVAAEPRREPEPGAMRFTTGAPVVAAVSINGVGLRLMIDTGADRTLITPAAWARTGLASDGGRQVRIMGVTGSSVATELVVAQMDVAGTRVGPVRVLVHDTVGSNIDGLLGRDVLDFFTLTIEGTAGRATLIPR